MQAPFAPGSVSIRLYPHNELHADAIVDELCAQARIALGNGFDGVMTSEHHGGFAGYMAQPLQMASFVLEEHATGWAAAAPLLLPLRSTAINSPCRKPVPRIGSWMSERFMKAEVRPGISETSAGGSRFETWFDMKMHARSLGTFSMPVVLKRTPAIQQLLASMKRVPL